ncbi:MAG: hypothetical protein CMK81_12280 [Pseudomonadales bacterium]|nr:hypothetical protein [Pseudomonadales bacterium]
MLLITIMILLQMALIMVGVQEVMEAALYLLLILPHIAFVSMMEYLLIIVTLAIYLFILKYNCGPMILLILEIIVILIQNIG